jgi:primary-amine oxidase
MSAELLQQVKSHLASNRLPHPFDPLSESEIKRAVSIVRKEHSALFFNAVTLWEPRKQEMKAWLQDPVNCPQPHRVADVAAIGKGSKVYDGIVDLNEGKTIQWELTDGVQPLVRPSLTDFDGGGNGSSKEMRHWKLPYLLSGN